MLRGRPVTAVIPVRAGSKGIPGKNLHRLGGDTLLERAIKLAQRCRRVDRVLVSTDSPEMQAIAARYGAAAPELRPAALASDGAKTVDVVEHLVASAGIPAGYILLLQATSPLRTLADLEALCAAFEAAGDAEAMVSVTPYAGPHPEKLQRIENGRIVSYLGTDSGRPRQELPDLYALNGAFYLIDRDLLLRGRSFLPEGTLPFVMPPERSVNLDTPLDLQIAEALLDRGVWTIERYD